MFFCVFSFRFDRMNRLTDATHCLYNLTPLPTVYSELGIQYDRNGNIKRLVRTGYTSAGTAGEIDRMRYNSYTGNQLVAIRDSAGSNVLYSGGFEFHQVNGYKTTQYAYNVLFGIDPHIHGFKTYYYGNGVLWK